MLSCMNDVALMSYAAVTMRHHPSKDTRTLVACVRHLKPYRTHTSDGRFRRLCVIVGASGARLERVKLLSRTRHIPIGKRSLFISLTYSIRQTHTRMWSSTECLAKVNKLISAKTHRPTYIERIFKLLSLGPISKRLWHALFETSPTVAFVISRACADARPPVRSKRVQSAPLKNNDHAARAKKSSRHSGLGGRLAIAQDGIRNVIS